MKINNYGNDYAYQRGQRSRETEEAAAESKPKPEPYVADEVQAGGEGSVAELPKKDCTEAKPDAAPEEQRETQRRERKSQPKAKQAVGEVQ